MRGELKSQNENCKMENSALSFGVREQGCRFPFGGLFLSPAPMGNLPHPSDPMPRTFKHTPRLKGFSNGGRKDPRPRNQIVTEQHLETGWINARVLMA